MKTPATSLEYALLALVHQAPRSGYDLRKIFETTPMGHFSSSPGSIYPALRRLKQRGLIKGRVDRSTSLRPRELFRPTVAGRKMFRAWLARRVEPDDVIRNLDELMLRFAFHSFLHSPPATRAFLTGFLQQLDDYVKQLRQDLRQMSDSAPIHGRLAVECGLESYEAYRRWARKALREFQE